MTENITVIRDICNSMIESESYDGLDILIYMSFKLDNAYLGYVYGNEAHIYFSYLDAFNSIEFLLDISNSTLKLTVEC